MHINTRWLPESHLLTKRGNIGRSNLVNQCLH